MKTQKSQKPQKSIFEHPEKSERFLGNKKSDNLSSKFFRNPRFQKKAQISSQVFTYIMAAIIIGAIVLVGFNGIALILNKFREAPLIQFESNLKRQVSSSSTSYMSNELFEFSLPSTYDEVCFTDSLNVGNIDSSRIDNTIIRNKVENKVEENVFLMKRGKVQESYYVEDMDVLDDFLCLENKGKLEVWFKGMGKFACLKLEQTGSCE